MLNLLISLEIMLFFLCVESKMGINTAKFLPESPFWMSPESPWKITEICCDYISHIRALNPILGKSLPSAGGILVYGLNFLLFFYDQIANKLT
jgi:hypothetical protein